MSSKDPELRSLKRLLDDWCRVFNVFQFFSQDLGLKPI
jgi:hypothetical protein